MNINNKLQYRDIEWLKRQYIILGLNHFEIANKCGASPSAVYRALKTNSINRNKSEARVNYLKKIYKKEFFDKEYLYNLYWKKGKSLNEIGELLSKTEKAIRRQAVASQLKRLGIKTRTRKEINEQFIKGKNIHTEETKKKMSKRFSGKNNPMYGKEITEEHRAKLVRASTGRKHTLADLEKMSKSQRGSKGHNWQGGITPEDRAERMSFKYKVWRNKVYKRDKYICQECGHNKDLHAHHIKSFTKYKKLRYELSNGKTLCKPCHWKAHTKKK